jgi:hypothetical protein
VFAASITTAIDLKMETASTSETSVNFYLTTRRKDPEDNHLHNRRCENLKSHTFIYLSVTVSSLDYVESNDGMINE